VPLGFEPVTGGDFVSHIVQIKTQVKDAAALRAACQRLGLASPVESTVKLFSATVTGHAVKLPDWTYPVVFQLASGDVRFDNFEGRWGDQEKLSLLLQAYAVEKAKIESRKAGHSVIEQPLADGSIKLTINVGA
jgi:hypothetical protein